ncbi:MAG TPA: HAMP domain-containing sensor histidine kinase, partial [Candidatus Sulfotelmatobacter sp.]|nr:HAMP domain-containing sensor histidine kinase [Candidatus Sulfotelmatobacter sp.]
AKLEEMVAELEHMSQSMVHSMRAPLRAILSFAELIERREGQRLRSDSRELFARMGRSIHQMDQLITDTLNYNKAVRSRLPLGPTNVGELLQGLLRAYAEFQPPQTEVRLEGECPWVLGNESGLTQCFSELLRNAVKFVRPGTPPRVKVWAEVLTHAPAERAGLESGPPGAGNKWVRIWVEDNGTGIPQEGQARIFEMFQRMHGSEYEGTGIGLALVRKLVERMGGHIGVESVEGQGSRFWMELKAAEPLDRTD